MHKIGDIVVESAQAFSNFLGGLRKTLEVSPKEIRARIAADNVQRTAERVQKGYAKRGPKSKNLH